ncbi:ribonuclease H-like domain-containing protein [Bacillus sp. 1NLA3E]|uniref:ribonuclease H-like domain-containing protein n=1 Tax=Bacillus sp. 1NLA3E TaxID=666686 RepID=UPI000247F4BB|nr:ribonuclease H-like domain-containing protein [Bacillus sp. 1NLA3E]AGK54658.1 hypothetical protein B1NLA3E_14560 [Bacillus sp. 1NLA3E]
MSLKKKLNRLKPHLGVMEKEKTERILDSTTAIPYLDEWEKEQVKPFYFDNDYCLVREVTYPLSYQCGKYPFLDLFTAVQAWNEGEVNHPLSAAGHKPEDLFFFDTETTGLGGGAGNTIFLLGYARVTDSQITVKQHILPHPGAEIALYQSFLECVDYKTLVTYNGKAFDWPQVKTRHTLVRDHVPKLPEFGHFDLYHASRRMWKHKLEKMKLSIVEKEVLGIERKDDVPGFLAPMIYFDFLERKQPEGLIGILKHNEQDILSLISLYIHLSFQLLRLDQDQTSQETFEVGKWFAALGQSSIAKDAFKGLVNDDPTDSFKAMHALAFEHKRSKEWSNASLLWQRVAECGPPTMQIEACIELAKIYEHRQKDIELALRFSEQAHRVCNKVTILKEDRLFQEIERRLTRLRKKSSKSIKTISRS